MQHHRIAMIMMIVSLVSCGHGNEPHSSPLDYRSLSKQLYAKPGKSGGHCIYARERDGATLLITKAGALSDYQLGQALRYISHWEQTASAALPAATFVYVVVRFLKRSTSIFDESIKAGYLNQKSFTHLAKTSIGSVLLLGTAHVANGLYRIIRGFHEGEDIGAISAQFFFGWMPTNFIIEEWQRRGRTKALLNEYAHYDVSENKANRVIGKMSKQQPAFPDGCEPVATE